MSHVADGDLHAYLDGALEFYPPRQAKRIREHLERCAVCRRRLDAESRVAGEARTVLAEATPPELIAPPLEELRRRAELRPVVETPARTSWRVHWAWAATVILALGIGWGVGAWPGGSGPEEATRSEAASPAREPAAAPPDVRAAEADAAPAEGAAAVVAESETAQKSEAPGARMAESSAGADVSPSASAAPSAQAGTEERRSALADQTILERRAPQLSTPSIVGDASARLSELAGASVGSSAPRETVVTTGSASAANAAVAGGRSEQSAQLERPMVSQSRLATGAPGELRFSDPRSQPAGFGRGLNRQLRASQEAPVRPPLTLPGLSVELVEEGDVGPETAVRVVQQHTNGTRVELFFVGVFAETAESARRDDATARVGVGSSSAVGAPAPAAPPPAAAPARTPTPPEHVATFRVPIGVEQLIVPFRGGWLIVQAPLSRAAIRELLESAGVPLP